MAVVAMEVAWRGAEQLGSSPVLEMKKKKLSCPVLDMKKKKRASWGVDAQKVVQLMMGQLRFEAKPAEDMTLDLLGKAAASPSPACGGAELVDCSNDDAAPSQFLELDFDQPFPSGWEKCLDFKTGKLYFVNKTTGVSSTEDPRKQRVVATELPTPSPLAHEFLGSKESETLRQEFSLKTSSSSSSCGGSPSPRGNTSEPVHPLRSFNPTSRKQQWNSQQLADDRSVSLQLINLKTSSLKFTEDVEDLELESSLSLNLNLSADGAVASPSSPHHHHQQEQSVCTMEMVQKALQRTEKVLLCTNNNNNKTTTNNKLSSFLGAKQHSLSSCFSSGLTSTRSHEPSWLHASPSTSSSESSTSSRSSLLGAQQRDPLEDLQASKPSTPGVCEAESKSRAEHSLVMGACTRCLMYVMLNKCDPKCPRCQSDVPLDFGAPQSSLRQRGDHGNSGSETRH